MSTLDENRDDATETTGSRRMGWISTSRRGWATADRFLLLIAIPVTIGYWLLRIPLGEWSATVRHSAT